MRETPDRLYHYTCAHQAELIEADQLIRPHMQVVLPVVLAWFTDLTPPVPREAVGLTNHLVGCDRTEAGWRVQTQGVLPWSVWRNTWLRQQLTQLGTREWREARQAALRLESAPGSMPSHWYVSEHTARIIERIDTRPALADAGSSPDA